jgi:hypothetical protein
MAISSYSVAGALWVPVSLSTLVVAVRIYCRMKTLHHKLTFSDYSIIVTALLNLSLCPLIGVMLAETITFSENNIFYYAGMLIQIAAVWTCKISINAFYHDLFRVCQHAWWIKLNYVVLGITGLAAFLLLAFPCWPVSDFWSSFNAFSDCSTSEITNLTADCLNFSTDIILILLPWLYIAKLRTARKWALGVLFSLGVVVIILCATRLLLVRLLLADIMDYRDLCVTVFGIFIAESNLRIWVACAPMIYVFFRRLRQDHRISFGRFTPSLSSGEISPVSFSGKFPNYKIGMV